MYIDRGVVKDTQAVQTCLSSFCCLMSFELAAIEVSISDAELEGDFITTFCRIKTGKKVVQFIL